MPVLPSLAEISSVIFPFDTTTFFGFSAFVFFWFSPCDTEFSSSEVAFSSALAFLSERFLNNIFAALPPPKITANEAHAIKKIEDSPISHTVVFAFRIAI